MGKDDFQSGFFQFNDIVLNIPPSQIVVQRANRGDKVSNLRTSSQATIWSRASQTSVEIKMIFTDGPGRELIEEGEFKGYPKHTGISKMKDLISQVKVTPFCYIRNEFLRKSILGGVDTDDAMVFVVRRVHISTASNATNSNMPGTVIVDVTLNHTNHTAYVEKFKYRLAPFSLEMKDDPRQSLSWKIMYRAEQKRRNYTDIASLDGGGGTTGNTIFSLNEFRLFPLPIIKQRLEEMSNARKLNSPTGGGSTASHPGGLGGEGLDTHITGNISNEGDEELNLSDISGIETELESSNGEIFSGETTMLDQVVEALGNPNEDKLLQQNIGEENLLPVMNWEPYRLRDGSYFKVGAKKFQQYTDADLAEKYNDGDLILFRRRLALSTEDNGIHVLGISIDFGNRVAALPLLGSSAASHQYIGGVDASVTISMKTTNDAAVRKLVGMQRLWQSQTTKMKQLPLKLRRVKIKNDLLNICGLHYFLLDHLNVSTVPGEPGSTFVHMNFSEKEFDGSDESFTYESFNYQPGAKVLKALYKVFNKRMFLLKNQFTEYWGSNKIRLKSRNRRTGGEGYLARQVRGGGALDVDDRGEELQADGKETMGSWATDYQSNWTKWIPFVAHGTFKQGIRTDSLTTAEKVYDRIYKVVDPEPEKLMDTIYRDLLKEYSVIFSNFVLGLVKWLQVTEGIESGRRIVQVFDMMNLGKELSQKFLTPGGIMNPMERIRLSTEWEYKRWRFIKELTDEDVLGIGRAKLDAYLILTDEEVNATNGMYYTDLWAGKINRNHLEMNTSYEEKRYKDMSTVDYDRQEIWDDFKSQDFAIQWVSQRRKFFGKILRDKSFIQIIAEKEPSILKELEEWEGSKTNMGTNAYPDFPMEEVLEIMESIPGIKDGMDKLKKQIVEVNKSIKNGKYISLPRLYGPDFYLVKNLVSIDESLGQAKLKNAASLIERSHKNKPEAYNTWLSEVYEKQIGPKLEAESKMKRLDKSQDKEFYKSKAAQLRYNRDIESGNAYTISDYEEVHSGGLNLPNLPHNIVSQTPISNPSQSNILDLAEPLAITPELMKAYSIPIFQWPVTRAESRITSPYGKIRGAGKKPHRGVDIANIKRNKTSGTKIYAAGDGYIIDMRPRTSVIERKVKKARKMTPSTPSVAGAVMPVGGSMPSRQSWTEYFMERDEIDPLDSKAVAAYREKKGYSEDFWEALSKKEHDRTLSMTIAHADGKWHTVYKHMRDDDDWKSLYNEWIKSGKNLEVKRGEHLCNIGNTGFSSGPHLHFELIEEGKAKDPYKHIIQGLYDKSKMPKFDFQKHGSVLNNSYDKFNESFQKSQGMIRAYPTFKLYFVESDRGERELFGFDDFFAFQAVQEIQLVRNADNPVDLCLIRLTNLTGNLSNRKFKDLKQGVGSPESYKNKDKPKAYSVNEKYKRAKEDPLTAMQGKTDTAMENPIASLLLRTGTQIQLRMGYNPNPDELPIVFNGAVTDIKYHGTDDMITITCQSFAMELVSTLQGIGEQHDAAVTEFKKGKSSRSGEIIETLMTYPELKHFGRWQKGTSTGFNDIADESDTDTMEPGDEFETDTLNFEEWKLVKHLHGDNVYVPAGGTAGLMEGTNFKIYKTTIWDIVQELTHRHPGFIAYPVPYEGKWGPRMTLYFGLPSGNYVARDPTDTEKEVARKMRYLAAGSYISEDGAEKARKFIWKFSQGAVDFDESILKDLDLEDPESFIDQVDWVEDEFFGPDLAIGRDYAISKALYEYGKNTGIVSSFRNYHLLDNMHHIIQNSIISSSYSTFNSATIEYTSNEYADGGSDEEITAQDAKTITLTADASIPPEEIREVYANFPNCIGSEQAKRYGQSLLWRSMKKGYRGGLVIMGNPEIKPYDICYVFDTFTEMYGPIEVEQVVHKFSHASGFVTEITPRMCIHINEEASMGALDVMGMVAEDKIGSLASNILTMDFMPDTKTGDVIEGGVTLAGLAALGVAGMKVVGAGAVGVSALVVSSPVLVGLSILGIASYFFMDNLLLDDGDQYVGGESVGPLDAIGLFCFRKMITRTQMQHLFEYSPLTVRGRPLLGGLPVNKKPWGPGSFIQNWVSENKDWWAEGYEGRGLEALEKDKQTNPEFYFDE